MLLSDGTCTLLALYMYYIALHPYKHFDSALSAHIFIKIHEFFFDTLAASVLLIFALHRKPQQLILWLCGAHMGRNLSKGGGSAQLMLSLLTVSLSRMYRIEEKVQFEYVK